MSGRPDDDHAGGFVRPAVWVALITGLALWAAWRLEAFALWATVPGESGDVRFPNGFAIVDHPFHAVRAETLRRTLADGELLRWIGHHQGGYPVEFYPLGVAWLDVAVWTALLGQVPMMAVHKLTVLLIFILPLAAYAWFAHADRRVLGVALVAGAGHLVVRGWWWSGGVMETVEWGLVTNVAGATAAAIAMPSFAAFLRNGRPRAGGLAALSASAALFANPRSGIALAAVIAGALLVALAARVAPAVLIGRLAVAAGVTALLAAPLILPLLRFGDLYYFVHYSGYADMGAYLESSVRATGGPIFVAGAVGLAVPWLERGREFSRVVSATAVVYVAITAFLALSPWPTSVIDQLEATRLMPFQRLLWFWLAAIAVDAVLRFSLRRTQRWTRRAALDGGLLFVAAAFPVLYVIAPPSFIPEGDRGLVVMPGSAQPGIVDLEAAVRAADVAAVQGSALLVLGTTLSWHDQLWGPLWSDRPFYYDDWLWYWHRDHVGAYDPDAGHAYPDDASALRPEYLETHAIGAVVVTGPAREAAAGSAWLEPIRAGIWDVYLVREPATIVTFDGANAGSIDVENQHLSATGDGGEIVVRRNWFPRWQSTVDGFNVPVERTGDGYMRLRVPEGNHDVTLGYRVDALDWLGRLCAVLGGLSALVLVGPASLRPWEKQRRPRATGGGDLHNRADA